MSPKEHKELRRQVANYPIIKEMPNSRKYEPFHSFSATHEEERWYTENMR